MSNIITSNVLTGGNGSEFEHEELYVPLGLVEPTFSRLFKTKNNIGEKTSQETAKSNFVCQ
jgi:hypothetical protein